MHQRAYAALVRNTSSRQSAGDERVKGAIGSAARQPAAKAAGASQAAPALNTNTAAANAATEYSCHRARRLPPPPNRKQARAGHTQTGTSGSYANRHDTTRYVPAKTRPSHLPIVSISQ